MTSEDIKNLLEENKKRLLQEVQESKELLFLLKESTTRKLSDEEKAKVNEQLLDVCKAIPALAIFLLPGGALLLPLVIKFLPSILPSAFRKD